MKGTRNHLMLHENVYHQHQGYFQPKQESGRVSHSQAPGCYVIRAKPRKGSDDYESQQNSIIEKSKERLKANKHQGFITQNKKTSTISESTQRSTDCSDRDSRRKLHSYLERLQQEKGNACSQEENLNESVTKQTSIDQKLKAFIQARVPRRLSFEKRAVSHEASGERQGVSFKSMAQRKNRVVCLNQAILKSQERKGVIPTVIQNQSQPKVQIQNFIHHPTLIPEDYDNFLTHYEDSMLRDHLNTIRQQTPAYYQISERHPEITEALRAKLLDWTIHCTQICDMDEKNIFFMAVALVDKYYQLGETCLPKSDIQLTAVAALFIASKMLQIDHINIDFCYKNLSHGKYSYEEILAREEEILTVSGWDIYDYHSIYETFELLIVMLKKRVQTLITDDKAVEFLNEVQSLAHVLIRASVCNLDTYKVDPAIRVASLIQIALAYTGLKHRDCPESMTQEILQVVTSWKDLAEQKLGCPIRDLKLIGFRVVSLILDIDDACKQKLQDILVLSPSFKNWAQDLIATKRFTQGSSLVYI